MINSRLTSVGAGLLESSVCGWASDISDSFSSSSSWMGEDGDLRALVGTERFVMKMVSSLFHSRFFVMMRCIEDNKPLWRRRVKVRKKKSCTLLHLCTLAYLSGDLLTLLFCRLLSLKCSGELSCPLSTAIPPEKLISSYKGADGMAGETDLSPFRASRSEMGSKPGGTESELCRKYKQTDY